MNLLSKEEKEIIVKLGQCWSGFLKLEELYPNDKQEILQYIHAAQNIIMARPIKREFKNE